MLLKLVALALLPAATLAADATSALECQNEYVQKSFGVTGAWSTEDRCEALITFSKCLSAFPESSIMEAKLVEDNGKDCEPFWRSDSSPDMKVRRNNFQLTVDDAKDIKFFRHRREELSIFEMNQQIVDLQKLVSDLTKTQTQTQTQLESVNSNVVNNVQNKLDAMKQDQDDAKKIMDDAMDNLKDGVTSQVNNVKTLVTDSVLKLTSDTNKALETQSTSVLSKVDTKVKSLNASVSAVAVVAQAAKAGLVDKPIHMWSGGPRSHNRGNSWHDFVMDRVEYDTAAPYFERQTNNRFRALKSGLFKVDYNALQHGNGHCWRHMKFYVDGKHLNYEHRHTESNFNMLYTAMWHIKAGQQFWATFYVSCGNPYVFQGSSAWKGAYSRVQVEYVGQFAGKCASNQGLCP